MNALVLEGGGVKGSYQIGAYLALKENGIEIDGFYGTSIGSFNAAVMAVGKEEELLHFWMNLDPGSIFGFEEEISKAINAEEYDLKFFLSTAKTLYKALRNRGIDIEPLLEALDTIITEEEIVNCDKDYGLLTVRVNNASPVEIYKETIPEGKFKECILASCYLPVFRAHKIIDDSYYVDGGFYDCCPINTALKHKKYDTVYAIRINGVGFKKPVIDSDAKVITIGPRRPNGGVFELKREIITNSIKMGYYDTIREINHYDGYNYIFKNINDNYIKLITRKIGKKEMNRIKNFFNVDNKKDAVVRALEYVLAKENVDYYDIYNFYILLWKYRDIKKDHFVYKFVNKLRII